LKIALFAESFLPKWDGVANTTCHLLEYLAKHGHETLMFAPKGAPERYAETPIIGYRAFSFPWYKPLRLAHPDASIRRYLQRFSPDVVHVINPAFLGKAGLKYAHQLGVPVLASYHTDFPGYCQLYGLEFVEGVMWNFFRNIHNQAEWNVAPSEFTRNELLQHGFQRFGVWPHGVDIELYNPNNWNYAMRERLTNGHPEDTLLLYVGRLAKEKRIEWLADVMETLPQVRCALVGDGPEREHLEHRLDMNRCVFTGYLKGAELGAAYACGDIFCFPSANETFGNVVLEAMASGVPVVAPRSGGPANLVEHERTGFLCGRNDLGEFIDFASILVRNTDLRRQMGREARHQTELQSWDDANDLLMQAYTRVARMRPVPSRLSRVFANPSSAVNSFFPHS